MIFTAHITRSVLSTWKEQGEVIGPHELLCKVNNSCGQTGFTVVVCGVLRNVPDKLGDLETPCESDAVRR